MALHERSLKEGDKVTLARMGSANVIRGFVEGHDADGRPIVSCSPTTINFRIVYSDEGIRWIRGHVRDGTRDAEALLAAHKISRMVE